MTVAQVPSKPTWVEQDPEWREALHLLDSPLLAAKGCRRYVDFEHRRIRFPALLRAARAWSDGERLLVRAAAALFNGGQTAGLGELVRVLDDANLARVLEAVRRFRGR